MVPGMTEQRGSFEHKGVTYSWDTRTGYTEEELAALKAKQASCKHDSMILLLSCPPKCPLCLKDMK